LCAPNLENILPPSALRGPATGNDGYKKQTKRDENVLDNLAPEYLGEIIWPKKQRKLYLGEIIITNSLHVYM